MLVPVSMLAAMAISIGAIPTSGEVRAEAPALVLMSIAAVFLSIGLGLPRVQLKSYELSALSRSAALGGVLAGLLIVLRLVQVSGVENGTPIVLALIYSVFSGASRVALLKILMAIYRHNLPETRVMIYGAGKTGIQLAMALRTSDEVRLVGFVDDNSVLHGMSVAGQTVYPAQRIESLIHAHGVDRVLLAMPSLSQPRQAQIARRIAGLHVDVQALPSFAQLIGEEEIVNKLTPVLPNSVLGRKHLKDALDGGCSAYEGRVVMITGAGGSIGSEICRQILACKPRKLVLFELTEFALFNIDRELRALAEGTDCDIVPILGSVTDRRVVEATIARQSVQVILHAAAYKHVPMVEQNPLAGIANNVFGTQVVAQAANDAGLERFVLVSTDKAVRPIGVMGATKRMAELIVGDMARRSAGTIFTMVRFGNVLGSSGSVVPIFYEQVSRGGPVTVTDKDVTRYFMTIQEACRLVLWSGTLAQGGEIFVLDMGEPVRIADLARQVIEAAGYSVRDGANPEGDIEIITTGLRDGEKLHEELTVARKLERTAHPKLGSARESMLSEFEITRALSSLQTALEADDANTAVDEMMRWLRRDLENQTLPANGDMAAPPKKAERTSANLRDTD
ncbi:polysaccharide biosynthesis protein [Cereibacter sphaeroides]|nr:polysaccharide biosynthesis protein [Cereibacter sphaeroides]